jgi:hypothetical protein
MGWRIFIPNTSLFVKVLQKPMGCNRQNLAIMPRVHIQGDGALNVILGPPIKTKIFNQFTFDGVEISKFKIQEK